MRKHRRPSRRACGACWRVPANAPVGFAGVYGAATVSRRILYVQAAPAAVALILLFLA
ncbi:DUF1304 family protein [Bradyrhizobium sp.]|uniref:DUF1304 family protein n=1 Tax=Bradyrhizobium sp. TaxID=376 RepID=UPI003C71E16B